MSTLYEYELFKAGFENHAPVSEGQITYRICDNTQLVELTGQLQDKLSGAVKSDVCAPRGQGTGVILREFFKMVGRTPNRKITLKLDSAQTPHVAFAHNEDNDILGILVMAVKTPKKYGDGGWNDTFGTPGKTFLGKEKLTVNDDMRFLHMGAVCTSFPKNVRGTLSRPVSGFGLFQFAVEELQKKTTLEKYGYVTTESNLIKDGVMTAGFEPADLVDKVYLKWGFFPLTTGASSTSTDDKPILDIDLGTRSTYKDDNGTEIMSAPSVGINDILSGTFLGIKVGDPLDKVLGLKKPMRYEAGTDATDKATQWSNFANWIVYDGDKPSGAAAAPGTASGNSDEAVPVTPTEQAAIASGTAAEAAVAVAESADTLLTQAAEAANDGDGIEAKNALIGELQTTIAEHIALINTLEKAAQSAESRALLVVTEHAAAQSASAAKLEAFATEVDTLLEAATDLEAKTAEIAEQAETDIQIKLESVNNEVKAAEAKTEAAEAKTEAAEAKAKAAEAKAEAAEAKAEAAEAAATKACEEAKAEAATENLATAEADTEAAKADTKAAEDKAEAADAATAAAAAAAEAADETLRTQIANAEEVAAALTFAAEKKEDNLKEERRKSSEKVKELEEETSKLKEELKNRPNVPAKLKPPVSREINPNPYMLINQRRPNTEARLDDLQAVGIDVTNRDTLIKNLHTALLLLENVKL